jgi:hypothetical protein
MSRTIMSRCLLLVAGAVLVNPGLVCAWEVYGLFGCKCPPPYIHCPPGPPRLKYKCACPKPVCGPCELEGWGYYQTCWRHWPWPPSCDHCQPQAPLGMFQQPAIPVITPNVTNETDPLLPRPRMLTSPTGPGY